MATTPNYGWVTPAPTDFVTDLPADFEVFADAVDADLAGLLGGTTGQVLVKNSGTDHDFDFATDPVSDIITTAGDVLYGTAADTLARLGIGTANQVLAVNSGATAPEWVSLSSGSLTLLSTTSLTGSTVNLTSISGIYKELVLVLDAFSFSSSDSLGIRFNNNSTSNNYVYSFTRSVGNTAGIGGGLDTQVNATPIAQFLLDTQTANCMIMNIPNYASTTARKIGSWVATAQGEDAGNPNCVIHGGFAFFDTTAITEINLRASVGTNFDNGTAYLYGVL